MITDIEYRDVKDHEENTNDPIPARITDTSSHRLNIYNSNDREEKLLDLSHRLWKYCHKANIPIFDRLDMSIILVNLFE